MATGSWDTASVRECYTPVDVVRDWRKEERVVRVSTTHDVHERKWSPTEGWISNTSKDVQEREAKYDGPDVHAHGVRLGVVETSQDVGHGEEPEEDGKCPCGCEDVSDCRGLLEDT